MITYSVSDTIAAWTINEEKVGKGKEIMSPCAVGVYSSVEDKGEKRKEGKQGKKKETQILYQILTIQCN